LNGNYYEKEYGSKNFKSVFIRAVYQPDGNGTVSRAHPVQSIPDFSQGWWDDIARTYRCAHHIELLLDKSELFRKTINVKGPC
jgi:hypothetical protein